MFTYERAMSELSYSIVFGLKFTFVVFFSLLKRHVKYTLGIWSGYNGIPVCHYASMIDVSIDSLGAKPFIESMLTNTHVADIITLVKYQIIAIHTLCYNWYGHKDREIFIVKLGI